MKTLNDIRGRCHIDEAGHWIWKGSLRPDGRANIYAPDYTRGGMSVQAGPRAVWHVVTGHAIPAGWLAYGKCKERACCNPACIGCAPSAEVYALVAASGVLKGQVRRILANRRISRGRSKLTPEVIAEIQQSDETGVALAARLRLNRQLISKARRGEALAFQPLGGVFGGLAA